MDVVRENALMIIVALVLVAVMSYIVFMTTGGVETINRGINEALCTATASLKGYMFGNKYIHWAYYKYPEIFSKVERVFPLMCKKEVYYVSPASDYKPVNKYDKVIKEKWVGEEGSSSDLAYWRLVYLLRDQARKCLDMYNHGDPLFPGGYGKNPAICSVIYYDLNNTYKIKYKREHFSEGEYGWINPGVVPLRADDDLIKFVEKNLLPNGKCDALVFNTGTDLDILGYANDKCEQAWSPQKAKDSELGCDEQCMFDFWYGKFKELDEEQTGKFVKDYLDGKISSIEIASDPTGGKFIWCDGFLGLYQKALGNADYRCINLTFDKEYNVKDLLNDIVRNAKFKWKGKKEEINTLGMNNWICGIKKGDRSVSCPLYGNISVTEDILYVDYCCPSDGVCIYLDDWMSKWECSGPIYHTPTCTVKPNPEVGVTKPASLSKGVIFVTFLDLWDDMWNDVVWGGDFLGEGKYVPRMAAIPPNNKVVFVIFDESWMLPGRGVIPTNDPGQYPSFGCLESQRGLIPFHPWSKIKREWLENWAAYERWKCKSLPFGINYIVCD